MINVALLIYSMTKNKEYYIRRLRDLYSLSQEINYVEAPESIIVSITHIVHQYEEINCAAIFGSRAKSEKQVTDESDIDIILKIDENNKESWGRVSNQILIQLEDAVGENIKFDLCISNNPHKDPNFMENVKKQMVLIKGSKNQFK